MKKRKRMIVRSRRGRGRVRKPGIRLAATKKEMPAIRAAPRLPAAVMTPQKAVRKRYASAAAGPIFPPRIGDLCHVCNQIIPPADRDRIDGMHGHCFDRQPFSAICRQVISHDVEIVLASYPDGPALHPDKDQLGELLLRFGSHDGSSTNGRARRSIDALLRKMEAIYDTARQFECQEALAAVCLQGIADIRRKARGHLPPRRLSTPPIRYSLAVGEISFVRQHAVMFYG
jgi:hypothetical protein